MKDISVFYNKTHSSQGFSAYNPDDNNIIVSFRGTHDIKNWISDLDFIKTTYDKCDGCEVHKGFWIAY